MCGEFISAHFLQKEENTINNKAFKSLPVKPDKVSRDLVNERIPFQTVMVIGPDGVQLGVMKRNEALRVSEDMGLDLLVVSSKSTPPVCKILDYGKYHFEKQKKDRQLSRNQRLAARDAKEIKFKMSTGDHDIEYKIETCRKYLEKGMKVKLTICLRGREVTKSELIEAAMNKIIALLKDYGTIDKKPVQEGKTYSCLVNPIKK